MAPATDQFADAVRELIPINGLPEQHQEEVLRRGKVVKYRKGRYVFKQGDKDNLTFFVLEGELHHLHRLIGHDVHVHVLRQAMTPMSKGRRSSPFRSSLWCAKLDTAKKAFAQDKSYLALARASPGAE